MVWLSLVWGGCNPAYHHIVPYESLEQYLTAPTPIIDSQFAFYVTGIVCSRLAFKRCQYSRRSYVLLDRNYDSGIICLQYPGNPSRSSNTAH